MQKLSLVDFSLLAPLMLVYMRIITLVCNFSNMPTSLCNAKWRCSKKKEWIFVQYVIVYFVFVLLATWGLMGTEIKVCRKHTIYIAAIAFLTCIPLSVFVCRYESICLKIQMYLFVGSNYLFEGIRVFVAGSTQYILLPLPFLPASPSLRL